MKIKYLSLIVAFIFGSAYANGPRNLMVLIDWGSETVARDLDREKFDLDFPGFGPVSGALVTALEQRAAPILVSASVWKNFVERRKMFQDFKAGRTAAYVGRYQRLSTESQVAAFRNLLLAYFKKDGETVIGDFHSPIRKEMNSYVLCASINFTEGDWILKKASDYFYLLIPKNYLNRVIKEPLPTIEYRLKENVNISGRELRLGLKYKPMADMTHTQALDPAQHSPDPSRAPVRPQDATVINLFRPSPAKNKLKVSSNFILILPEIFVTKWDLIDHEDNVEKTEEIWAYFLHTWHMFMVGHGSESTPGYLYKKFATPKAFYYEFAFATGLEIYDFRNFLSFLGHSINTQFLFYTSCFSGGVHLKKLYQHYWDYPPSAPGENIRARLTQDVYKYMIVTSNIDYRETLFSMPTITPPFKKEPVTRIRKIFPSDFPGFFNAIQKYFSITPTTIEQKQQYFDLQRELDQQQIIYKNAPKADLKSNAYFRMETIKNQLTRFDYITLKGVIEFVQNTDLQPPGVRFPGTGWFTPVALTATEQGIQRLRFESEEKARQRAEKEAAVRRAIEEQARRHARAQQQVDTQALTESLKQLTLRLRQLEKTLRL